MNNYRKSEYNARKIFFKSLGWALIIIALLLIGFVGAAFFTGAIK